MGKEPILSYLVRLSDIATDAAHQHVLDEHGVRLIAHLEHVFRIYLPETVVGGLQVVQSLTHVALRREHYGLQTIFSIRNLQKKNLLNKKN